MKRILLAEDDLDDQDIFRYVVNELDQDIELSVVQDGEKLIEFIELLPETDLPHLIVLDQNMPRLRGNETLSVLRSRPRYRDIPIILYSTYFDKRFIHESQRNEVELFLKPDTFDGLSKMIRELVSRFMPATQD